MTLTRFKVAPLMNAIFARSMVAMIVSESLRLELNFTEHYWFEWVIASWTPFHSCRFECCAPVKLGFPQSKSSQIVDKFMTLQIDYRSLPSDGKYCCMCHISPNYIIYLAFNLITTL